MSYVGLGSFFVDILGVSDVLDTGQLSAGIIAHKPYLWVIKNDFRPPRFEIVTLWSADLLTSGHVSIYIMANERKARKRGTCYNIIEEFYYIVAFTVGWLCAQPNIWLPHITCWPQVTRKTGKIVKGTRIKRISCLPGFQCIPNVGIDLFISLTKAFMPEDNGLTSAGQQVTSRPKIGYLLPMHSQTGLCASKIPPG